jgi:uncharacterized phage protein (TIGR02218 family)
MPRAISTSLKNHKAQPVTTTCKCWKLRRADGTVEGWTEHDVPIPYDGVTYQPLPAGTPSNYEQRAGLAAANLEIEMAYGAGTEALLRAGVYDYAEVWTFEINWADTSMGILKLAYGRMGEVVIVDHKARCEVRGLAQLLATMIGDVYTPECRKSLGDALCKIDLSGYTHAGTVSTITSDRIFTIAGAASGKATGYYNYGKITFSSGPNAGLSMQVESQTGDALTLIEPMPFTVAAADAFTLIAGCDRRLETCWTFVNAALQGGGTSEGSGLGNRKNFGGYPGLPGMAATMNIPANQQWTSG